MVVDVVVEVYFQIHSVYFCKLGIGSVVTTDEGRRLLIHPVSPKYSAQAQLHVSCVLGC